MLEATVRLESGAQLRTYAALLPLGLHELDDAIAREAAENPWLELRDRPVRGLVEAEREIAAAGPSLDEHLVAQLAGSGAAGAVLRGARYVIGSLDEQAYLRDDIAQIARVSGIGEADAERALELVQRLDPIGVAARSLGERFRLQLREAGAADEPAYALTFELDALAAAGPTAFAAARGLSEQSIVEALRRLRACDPHPARDFGAPIDRIHPEIRIERDGDVLRAVVDRGFWPDVELASLGVTRGLSAPMRAARSRARLIVDALARRQTTLERVAAALLERQERFFAGDGDRRELVPLTGRELARDIGCAESTISRAIADRYAATPFGTIPLRTLLARRPAGAGITAAAVRERLRALAQSEPDLSDAELARALQLRGVRLARRTVTKYRRQLGLGTSRARTPA